MGTTVNGKNIRGERLDLLKDDNEVKLGHNTTLRITWYPVVFSFVFSKAEMEQGALATIQAVLEPLDIKFVSHGKTNAAITHVVEKTKNRPRVLEALINGQLVVHQTFVDAIAQAVKPTTTDLGLKTSALEMDFEANWPDAAKYLPPGDNWADEPFAPNPQRREMFDGYTFIFYDERNHANFLPAITSAKGKALLGEVVPGQTDVDDFIRYVKGIAGEKGLGEFEDGSEGRGVVVVRHLTKDENEAWYLNFFNEFAQRLDHRPIEICDLLSAVLNVDPTMLRRQLEPPDPTPREPGTLVHSITPIISMLTSYSYAIPRSVHNPRRDRACRPRKDRYGDRPSLPELGNRRVPITAPSAQTPQGPLAGHEQIQGLQCRLGRL